MMKLLFVLALFTVSAFATHGGQQGTQLQPPAAKSPLASIQTLASQIHSVPTASLLELKTGDPLLEMGDAVAEIRLRLVGILDKDATLQTANEAECSTKNASYISHIAGTQASIAETNSRILAAASAAAVEPLLYYRRPQQGVTYTVYVRTQ